MEKAKKLPKICLQCNSCNCRRINSRVKTAKAKLVVCDPSYSLGRVQ